MGIDDLDLRHLRGIVALAEELNFGKAADRIKISQPALTRIVADVEDAAGARLFDRTTRRVTLTPVGEVFVAEVRGVLQRMDECVRQVEAAVRRQRGQLRLAYTPLAQLTVLPAVLTAWDTLQSEVRIEATETPNGAQRLGLATGRAEMALADEAFRGEEFQCICLYREPLAVVLPGTHPLASRTSVSLNDLRRDTFLLYPRADYPEFYDRFFAACAAAGFAPKIRYCEPGEDVLDAVLDGNGIQFTPANHSPTDLPELRFIPLDSLLPLYAEVWAVWLKNTTSPQVKALVGVVEELKHQLGSRSSVVVKREEGNWVIW